MRALLFLVIMVLAGPFFFFIDGAIIKDFRLKSDTLAPAFIQTTDRTCKSRLFVFHDCSYRYKFDHKDQKQDYFFFSFSPPETVMLLRGNNTGEITSDVGQDYLFNRIATIFAFPLLAIFAVVKALGRRNARTQTNIPTPPTEEPMHRAAAAPGNPAKRTEFGKRR